MHKAIIIVAISCLMSSCALFPSLKRTEAFFFAKECNGELNIWQSSEKVLTENGYSIVLSKQEGNLKSYIVRGASGKRTLKIRNLDKVEINRRSVSSTSDELLRLLNESLREFGCPTSTGIWVSANNSLKSDVFGYAKAAA